MNYYGIDKQTNAWQSVNSQKTAVDSKEEEIENLRAQLKDKAIVIERLANINTQLEELKKPQVAVSWTITHDVMQSVDKQTRFEELSEINRALAQELQAAQMQIRQLDSITNSLHRENEILQAKFINVIHAIPICSI